MTREQIGRRTGRPGRIDVFGAEPDEIDGTVGDAVEVDAVDARVLVHALTDCTTADAFVTVTPA
ncbi:hypothetical protein [Natrinema salaciae]|uniref:Uncharacterized protein n=1 Tax=Natrinema salaciae TaxID=1186196 RepID=A0A1H9NIB0_9EURY|nr:hypothetical protein [Natrinema salaciae]SER35700.1 hypothetical protein SAMN04489841_3614 [Natrinema salaciae]